MARLSEMTGKNHRSVSPRVSGAIGRPLNPQLRKAGMARSKASDIVLDAVDESLRTVL